MRSVTYLLSAARDVYDQWGLQADGLRLAAIHDIDVLADGSVIILFECADSPESLEAVCERNLADVMDYQIADRAGTARFKVHCCPSDVLADIIRLHREYPVLTDYPIEFVRPGESTVRVVKVGRTSDLTGYMRAIGDIADVTVEHIGRYEPAPTRAFGELTERQRTVLEMAVDEGYYDVPRAVTCEELARKLNCSAGTVSQHLRRIEAAVFSQFCDAQKPANST